MSRKSYFDSSSNKRVCSYEVIDTKSFWNTYCELEHLRLRRNHPSFISSLTGSNIFYKIYLWINISFREILTLSIGINKTSAHFWAFYLKQRHNQALLITTFNLFSIGFMVLLSFATLNFNDLTDLETVYLIDLVTSMSLWIIIIVLTWIYFVLYFILGRRKNNNYYAQVFNKHLVFSWILLSRCFLIIKSFIFFTNLSDYSMNYPPCTTYASYMIPTPPPTAAPIFHTPRLIDLPIDDFAYEGYYFSYYESPIQDEENISQLTNFNNYSNPYSNYFQDDFLQYKKNLTAFDKNNEYIDLNSFAKPPKKDPNDKNKNDRVGITSPILVHSQKEIDSVSYFFIYNVILDLYQILMISLLPYPWGWVFILGILELFKIIVRLLSSGNYFSMVGTLSNGEQCMFPIFYGTSANNLGVKLFLSGASPVNLFFTIAVLIVSSFNIERSIRSSYENYYNQREVEEEKKKFINILSEDICLPSLNIIKSIKSIIRLLHTDTVSPTINIMKEAGDREFQNINRVYSVMENFINKLDSYDSLKFTPSLLNANCTEKDNEKRLREADKYRETQEKEKNNQVPLFTSTSFSSPTSPLSSQFSVLNSSSNLNNTSFNNLDSFIFNNINYLKSSSSSANNNNNSNNIIQYYENFSQIFPYTIVNKELFFEKCLNNVEKLNDIINNLINDMIYLLEILNTNKYNFHSKNIIEFNEFFNALMKKINDFFYFALTSPNMVSNSRLNTPSFLKFIFFLPNFSIKSDTILLNNLLFNSVLCLLIGVGLYDNHSIFLNKLTENHVIQIQCTIYDQFNPNEVDDDNFFENDNSEKYSNKGFFSSLKNFFNSSSSKIYSTDQYYDSNTDNATIIQDNELDTTKKSLGNLYSKLKRNEFRLNKFALFRVYLMNDKSSNSDESNKEKIFITDVQHAYLESITLICNKVVQSLGFSECYWEFYQTHVEFVIPCELLSALEFDYQQKKTNLTGNPNNNPNVNKSARTINRNSIKHTLLKQSMANISLNFNSPVNDFNSFTPIEPEISFSDEKSSSYKSQLKNILKYSNEQFPFLDDIFSDIDTSTTKDSSSISSTSSMFNFDSNSTSISYQKLNDDNKDITNDNNSGDIKPFTVSNSDEIDLNQNASIDNNKSAIENFPFNNERMVNLYQEEDYVDIKNFIKFEEIPYDFINYIRNHLIILSTVNSYQIYLDFIKKIPLSNSLVSLYNNNTFKFLNFNLIFIVILDDISLAQELRNTGYYNTIIYINSDNSLTVIPAENTSLIDEEIILDLNSLNNNNNNFFKLLVILFRSCLKYNKANNISRKSLSSSSRESSTLHMYDYDDITSDSSSNENELVNLESDIYPSLKVPKKLKAYIEKNSFLKYMFLKSNNIYKINLTNLYSFFKFFKIMYEYYYKNNQNEMNLDFIKDKEVNPEIILSENSDKFVNSEFYLDSSIKYKKGSSSTALYKNKNYLEYLLLYKNDTKLKLFHINNRKKRNVFSKIYYNYNVFKYNYKNGIFSKIFNVFLLKNNSLNNINKEKYAMWKILNPLGSLIRFNIGIEIVSICYIIILFYMVNIGEIQYNYFISTSLLLFLLFFRIPQVPNFYSSLSLYLFNFVYNITIGNILRLIKFLLLIPYYFIKMFMYCFLPRFLYSKVYITENTPVTNHSNRRKHSRTYDLMSNDKSFTYRFPLLNKMKSFFSNSSKDKKFKISPIDISDSESSHVTHKKSLKPPIIIQQYEKEYDEIDVESNTKSNSENLSQSSSNLTQKKKNFLKKAISNKKKIIYSNNNGGKLNLFNKSSSIITNNKNFQINASHTSDYFNNFFITQKSKDVIKFPRSKYNTFHKFVYNWWIIWSSLTVILISFALLGDFYVLNIFVQPNSIKNKIKSITKRSLLSENFNSSESSGYIPYNIKLFNLEDKYDERYLDYADLSNSYKLSLPAFLSYEKYFKVNYYLGENSIFDENSSEKSNSFIYYNSNNHIENNQKLENARQKKIKKMNYYYSNNNTEYNLFNHFTSFANNYYYNKSDVSYNYSATKVSHPGYDYEEDESFLFHPINNITVINQLKMNLLSNEAIMDKDSDLYEFPFEDSLSKLNPNETVQLSYFALFQPVKRSKPKTFDEFLSTSHGRTTGKELIYYLIGFAGVAKFFGDLIIWPMSLIFNVVQLVRVFVIIIIILYPTLKHISDNSRYNDNHNDIGNSTLYDSFSHNDSIESSLFLYINGNTTESNILSKSFFYASGSSDLSARNLFTLFFLIWACSITGLMLIYILFTFENSFRSSYLLLEKTISHRIHYEKLFHYCHPSLNLHCSILIKYVNELLSSIQKLSSHNRTILLVSDVLVEVDSLKFNNLLLQEILLTLKINHGEIVQQPFKLTPQTFVPILTKQFIENIVSNFLLFNKSNNYSCPVKVFLRLSNYLSIIRVNEEFITACITNICKIAMKRIEQRSKAGAKDYIQEVLIWIEPTPNSYNNYSSTASSSKDSSKYSRNSNSNLNVNSKNNLSSNDKKKNNSYPTFTVTILDTGLSYDDLNDFEEILKQSKESKKDKSNQNDLYSNKIAYKSSEEIISVIESYTIDNSLEHSFFNRCLASMGIHEKYYFNYLNQSMLNKKKDDSNSNSENLQNQPSVSESNASAVSSSNLNSNTKKNMSTSNISLNSKTNSSTSSSSTSNSNNSKDDITSSYSSLHYKAVQRIYLPYLPCHPAAKRDLNINDFSSFSLNPPSPSNSSSQSPYFNSKHTNEVYEPFSEYFGKDSAKIVEINHPRLPYYRKYCQSFSSKRDYDIMYNESNKIFQPNEQAYIANLLRDYTFNKNLNLNKQDRKSLFESRGLGAQSPSMFDKNKNEENSNNSNLDTGFSRIVAFDLIKQLYSNNSSISFIQSKRKLAQKELKKNYKILNLLPSPPLPNLLPTFRLIRSPFSLRGNITIFSTLHGELALNFNLYQNIFQNASMSLMESSINTYYSGIINTNNYVYNTQLEYFQQYNKYKDKLNELYDKKLTLHHLSSNLSLSSLNSSSFSPSTPASNDINYFTMPPLQPKHVSPTLPNTIPCMNSQWSIDISHPTRLPPPETFLNSDIIILDYDLNNSPTYDFTLKQLVQYIRINSYKGNFFIFV